MRTLHFAIAPLFIATTLVCCGGSTTVGGPAGAGSSGSGSANGTVDGATFTVASELAFTGYANNDTACTRSSCTTTRSGQEVAVLLSNRADFTLGSFQSLLSNSASFANLDLLGLAVINQNGNLATGTYDIVGGDDVSGALASFETTTSTCATGLSATATSGTITLTQLSATSLAGTYDVTFGAQGTFSGAFNVPFGDYPDAGVSVQGVDAGQPVCEP